MILSADGTPYEYGIGDGTPSEIPTLWDMVDAQFSAAGFEAPFDRSVVLQIRKEVDPKFVPLAVKRVYKSNDGKTRVFEHHCVAWKITNPHKQHQQMPVTWPSDPSHVNYGMDGSALLIEDILDGDRDTDERLPGPFYPIDSGTLMILKAKKRAMEQEPENDAELARLVLEELQTKKRKDAEAARDEAHYRFDHEAKDWEDSFPIRKVSVPVLK